MPVKEAAALARVVDYIHLNPGRARVATLKQLIKNRSSSLNTLLEEARPVSLCVRAAAHS